MRRTKPYVIWSGAQTLPDAALASGEWDSQYGFLRGLPEFDMGYRLLIAGE